MRSLCRAVFSRESPQAIADLVQLGVSFDRSGDDLARTLEAAHSQARVLHAADRTGERSSVP
jgi:L-aspartate oxidase